MRHGGWYVEGGQAICSIMEETDSKSVGGEQNALVAWWM